MPSDLLVIGAGPAGCAAAITARRAGLSVVVLEAERRSRPRPGETLHPGVEPLLERLGVLPAVLDAGFGRHDGIRVGWDGPTVFQPYGSDTAGPWRGFQADRARFHEIVRAEVVRLGAMLVSGTRAERVLFADDATTVAGVWSGGRCLPARWTLDATGRAAWLARALGAAPRFASPSMQARYGWTRPSGQPRFREPRLKASNDGWSWRAPLADGREAWVSLTVGDGSDSSTDRRKRGVDVRWRLHPSCAAPGHILIGDAASLLDPSSSHGVLRALMSGMLAAHLVERCLRGGRHEAIVAGAYRSWVREQFEADAHSLGHFYRRHPAQAVAKAFWRAADASASPDDHWVGRVHARSVSERSQATNF